MRRQPCMAGPVSLAGMLRGWRLCAELLDVSVQMELDVYGNMLSQEDAAQHAPIRYIPVCVARIQDCSSPVRQEIQ